MINLKEYVKEGLFDNIDELEGKNGLESGFAILKQDIIDWITNNTKSHVYKI